MNEGNPRKLTFMDRLENERYELETKIIGLEKFFMAGEVFKKLDKTQRYLLQIQLDAMKSYLHILELRLIELKN